MDNKTRPSEVYTAINLNNARSEEEYTIKNEAKNNPQWGEEFTVVKLLHIAKVYWHPTSENPPIYKLENDQCYYVDMPHNPSMIEQQPIKINVINLDEGNQIMDIQELLQEIQLPPNLTQEFMRVHNLLSFLHLPTRHTNGKEPLIVYFQSHVVTSFEYLDILRRKTMEKVVAEEIRVGKTKDKEDRQVKGVAKLGLAPKRTTQKTIEKCVKAQVTATWTLVAIIEVDDHFHHDFQIAP
jgi:hypothetical protein